MQVLKKPLLRIHCVLLLALTAPFTHMILLKQICAFCSVTTHTKNDRIMLTFDYCKYHSICCCSMFACHFIIGYIFLFCFLSTIPLGIENAFIVKRCVRKLIVQLSTQPKIQCMDLPASVHLCAPGNQSYGNKV